MDIIVLILKTAQKSCDYVEIYSRLQAHLTTSQFMKFILELKKYNLLESMGSEARCSITPKGMQYLQNHDELNAQMQLEINRNSLEFGYRDTLLKFTNFSQKNNFLEYI